MTRPRPFPAPSQVRDAFQNPAQLPRLMTSLCSIGFGLSCLLNAPYLHEHPAYAGMTYLSQGTWGLLTLLLGVLLLLSPPGPARHANIAAHVLLWLIVSVSMAVGAGRVLTGTTTYAAMSAMCLLCLHREAKRGPA